MKTQTVLRMAVSLAVVLLLAVPGNAQQFEDDTAAAVPQDVMSALKGELFRKLVNPDGAKIRAINKAPMGDAWCGFINVPNGMGALTGYRAFAFRPSKPHLILAEIDESDPLYAISRQSITLRGCSIEMSF
ncbi:hypothetical protein K1W69_17270 [Hoeflea sp. WL0058]|uniref:Uncharacterized protein n=1 Tax=Flavimaribacter sediminis TaxID=2865987 RepID=A0AAE2ZQC9_9HYPH|nr:hypothetical protein [Flavimaribacter sediminis]MBW8638950.1 hypothetical protein [Flavimaribacter sediminis]